MKVYFLGKHIILSLQVRILKNSGKYDNLGYYLLPVSTLIEPPEELLVRAKSDKFIDSLKEEMLENPTHDVQPLLCIVN